MGWSRPSCAVLSRWLPPRRLCVHPSLPLSLSRSWSRVFERYLNDQLSAIISSKPGGPGLIVSGFLSRGKSVIKEFSTAADAMLNKICLDSFVKCTMGQYMTRWIQLKNLFPIPFRIFFENIFEKLNFESPDWSSSIQDF